MKLPRIAGLELVRRLKQQGFVQTQQRVSHVRLERRQGAKVVKLTIPLHKGLKVGTLHRIISEAGVSAEELERLK